MPPEKDLYIPRHSDFSPNTDTAGPDWLRDPADWRHKLSQSAFAELSSKSTAGKAADTRVGAAADLSQTSNSEFIKRVNEENTVSPLMEWGLFAAALATKGTAKAYVLSKLGGEMGAVGKYALPIGITAGVVGAGFLTYELADLKQNSGRASAFEKRLLSDPAAKVTEPVPQLKPADLPDGAHNHIFPGFRDVVNTGMAPVHSGFHYLLSGKFPDEKQDLIDKAIAHNHLSNEEYVNWAKQEDSITLTRQLTRDTIFGGVGLGGAVYAASKLGLGRYGVIGLAALGIAGGVGLSRLKTAADDRTHKATLYQTRLSLLK